MTGGGLLLDNTWYQGWGSNMVGSFDVSADWKFNADIVLGPNNWNFGSLIRFTATGGNYGTYGDEILNIDVTSWNELFIASDTLDYPDIYEWTPTMGPNSEFHLEVRVEGNVREVKINNNPVLYIDWLGERLSHQGV